MAAVITTCAICGDAIKVDRAPKSEAYCTECIQSAITHEKARVKAERAKSTMRREDLN